MLRTIQAWTAYCVKHGTSGEQVFDILNDWREEREAQVKDQAIIDAAKQHHPRAWKLLASSKPFLVVAVDEPYFEAVYNTIRGEETSKGTWSHDDQRLYDDLIAVSHLAEIEPTLDLVAEVTRDWIETFSVATNQNGFMWRMAAEGILPNCVNPKDPAVVELCRLAGASKNATA